MKYTLTLAILLLAATGWGQTNDLNIGTSPPPVAATCDITASNIVNGDFTSSLTITDKGIRKLAASGEICRVFGHWWPRFNDNALYVVNSCVVTKYRTCRICGKCESKTEGNWE